MTITPILPPDPTPSAEQIIAAKTQMLTSYMNRQVEAGKWLLASLLVVNGGAVAGLLSSDKVPAAALEAGGRWFVTGVGLAFASGIMSWAVADMNILVTRISLGVQMPGDDDIGDPKKLAKALHGFCSVMGFLFLVGSLGAFGYGAINVTDMLAAKKGPVHPSNPS